MFNYEINVITFWPSPQAMLTPVVLYAPFDVVGQTPSGQESVFFIRLAGNLRWNFGPNTFCTSDLPFSTLQL